MKKIMLLLGVFALSFGAVNANPGSEEVDARVLNAFKKEFATAKDIIWTLAPDYYQASFVYNEQHITAYYNTEGELLGLARFVSPVDLPMALQADLKRNYQSYWISNLFEAATKEGTTYYITIEDADQSVVLKSANARDWDQYKKVKKS